MLDWRGTTELGAVGRLGGGLLVDGAHASRNVTLDALSGVAFVAPMAGSDHLVELQSPAFAPLTLTAPGMALAFDLTGGNAGAVFPEAGGGPAIVSTRHGAGQGVFAAFDLPAALATGVWDAPFMDMLNMAAPLAADVRAGGTWVPVALDLTNRGQPVTIEVSALLSADLRLDGVPAGAALDVLGQPVWSLALGANEHRALRMALWMPGSSGAVNIPFLVSTVQGGTTQPHATVSVDLEVAAIDLHGPRLLAALQALAPDSPEEQAALDAASVSLADALARFADGRLVNALEAFLAADVHLSRIGGVPVETPRADLARLIAQAQAAVCNAPPQPCDVDGDVDVDKSDLSIISRARGQSASPSDPRDANGDGLISPADVKACIPQCTRPGCAI